jgi:hypothetical protein
MENPKSPLGNTIDGSCLGNGDVGKEENSLFLRLDRNIRDEIYRLILVKTRPLVAVNSDLPRKLQWTTEQGSQYNPRSRNTITTVQCVMIDPPDTQILCLNKQIYHEARDILYMDNTFSLDLAVEHGTIQTRINTLYWAPKLRVRPEQLTDGSYLKLYVPHRYQAALESAEHDQESTLFQFWPRVHSWRTCESHFRLV